MIRALCIVVLALVAAHAQADALVVKLAFTVVVDPVARTLLGEGTLDVPPGAAATVTLGDRFEATAMRWRGKPLARAANRPNAWLLPASSNARKVVAQWKGSLAALDLSLDHRQTLAAVAPVGDPAGTFLPGASGWYPAVDASRSTWRITIELPAGQRGLVPGRLVEERDDASGYGARFEFDAPADGIDLMAGPYTVSERTLVMEGDRRVRLRTYFAPGLESLADDYLASSADYLRLYDGWIGSYPFTEFSVVSSPTPTGFGMPTLTYLGADVLRLPFIRTSSLGHEVLHNWWGNGVYPDYARGNWSEGLTTFMADYQFKRREGEAAARDMRLAWLRDFAAVPPGQDEPLFAFTARTHGTSQIVGYHKTAMLFVMLRNLIGDETFDRAMRAFWLQRRFTVASWDDLLAAFEQASGRDLGAFFAQWTTRTGAPALRIDRAARLDGRTGVRVTITQDEPAYRLQVPLAIETDQGTVSRTVELDVPSRTVDIETPGTPRAVTLDPDLRLFRRLGPAEAPPILRDVMVNPATRALVLADEADYLRAAKDLLDRMLDGEATFERPGTAPGASPLVVIGTPSDVATHRARHRLGPLPDPILGARGETIWAERCGAFTCVTIVARNAAALEALARPLPHYGKQSWLTFENGKAVGRGVWPPQPARRIVD